MNFLRQPWQRLTVISTLAAVLYCSWPYGPLLDPTIGLKGSASELAAPHHPYHWFFEYGDVIASGLILLACAGLVHVSRQRNDLNQAMVSIYFIIGFCIFASLAALSPLQCLAAVEQCTHSHPGLSTIVHGLASVIGPFSLFWGLVYLWLKDRNKYFTLLVIAYAALGTATFIVQFTPGSDIVVQNIFITCCSLSIALYPYLFSRIYSPLYLKKSN